MAGGKYAYVFLVMKGDSYVPGALVAGYSLRLTKTPHDIVCMVTPDVTERKKLGEVFTRVVEIPYLEINAAPLRTAKQQEMYKSWMAQSPTKWQALSLVEYDKVVFLEADLLIKANVDDLFALTAPAATFSSAWAVPFVNPGMYNPYVDAKRRPLKHGAEVTPVMIKAGLEHENSFTLIGSSILLKPDKKDHERLLQTCKEAKSFGHPTCNSGTDEQLLATLYADVPWTMISPEYNFIPWKAKWLPRGATPKILHYFGKKPWAMPRDEWPDLKDWWEVYDILHAPNNINHLVAAKESSKESGKENIKENIKESIKENIKESAKESAKEAAFGLHVNRVYVKGTIVDQIVAAKEFAADCGFTIGAVALFLAGPRTQDFTIKLSEANALKAYLAETKLTAVAHGTYKDFPWNGNPVAMSFIRTEQAVCRYAGISGLVIHLPAAGETATLARHLKKCFMHFGVRIYLEMIAASPKKSQFHTAKGLRDLFAEIRKETDPELQQVGLCIDTAHLWSSGVDLASAAAATKWLAGLPLDVIPPDKIMWHLNDSAKPLGCGKDEHAGLFEGEIWKAFKDRPHESGLAVIVKFIRDHGMIAILERKPAEALAGDYFALAKLV
jgi:endonuclease IV